MTIDQCLTALKQTIKAETDAQELCRITTNAVRDSAKAMAEKKAGYHDLSGPERRKMRAEIKVEKEDIAALKKDEIDALSAHAIAVSNLTIAEDAYHQCVDAENSNNGNTEGDNNV